MHDSSHFIQTAQRVIQAEAQALLDLSSRIDDQFVVACELLLQCKGRIVVSGMGKSGHIAKKIAATLASTGSPAFFVHPGEASHGDLGMIKPEDAFIAISNSGTSAELLLIMPMIKRLGASIVTLTGSVSSPMAELATVNLDISVKEEACPLGLAPTTSTTATLAMGDAIAIALLDARGFSMDDFALSHPGGALGRKLLLRVSDIMVTGSAIPKINEKDTLRDALMCMTKSSFGMSIITDDQNTLKGIFTDGDLRRVIDQDVDLINTPITQVMTPDGHSTTKEALAVNSLDQMETHEITAMPVVDKNNQVVGAIKMHDLLTSGLI